MPPETEMPGFPVRATGTRKARKPGARWRGKGAMTLEAAMVEVWRQELEEGAEKVE